MKKKPSVNKALEGLGRGLSEAFKKNPMLRYYRSSNLTIPLPTKEYGKSCLRPKVSKGDEEVK